MEVCPCMLGCCDCVDPDEILAEGLPVVDTTEIVMGSSDGTKRIRFEVDGFASSNTTRVITVPDANHTIAGLEIANVFTANQTISKSTPGLTLNASGSTNGFITIQRGGTDVLSINASGTTIAQWDVNNLSGTHIFSIGAITRALLSKDSLLLSPATASANILAIQQGGSSNYAVQMGQLSGGADYGAFTLGNQTPSNSVWTMASRGDATDPNVYLNTLDPGLFVFRNANGTAGQAALGRSATGSNYGALNLGTAANTSGNWCLSSRFDATDPSVYYNTFNASGNHAFRVNGTDVAKISSSAVYPNTDASGPTLGGTSNRWNAGYFYNSVNITKGGASTDRVFLNFGSNGYAAPAAAGSNSNGDKILLYDNGSTGKYAIGISAVGNGEIFYQSVAGVGFGHDFYLGTQRTWSLREYTGNTAYSGLYTGRDTPASTNYILARAADATDGNTYLNAYTSSAVKFMVAGSEYVKVGTQGLGVGSGGTWGTSTTNGIYIQNGTAPSANPASGSVMFSQSGQLWVRDSGGNLYKMIKQTALTTALTTVTCSSPGTPDYAIQDPVAVGGYGFVTLDEALSLIKVVANLQTRVNEIESRFQTIGFFT